MRCAHDVSIVPDNTLLRRHRVLHPKLKRIVCCLAKARQQLGNKVKGPGNYICFSKQRWRALFAERHPHFSRSWRNVSKSQLMKHAIERTTSLCVWCSRSLWKIVETLKIAESYVEGIVPAMSDSSFRQHFRLLRRTAQKLVNLLGTCPEIPVLRERGRPTVEIEKQLLITLWYLGNPECIRSA